ncbi:MAG TPA: hypothetical protein VFD61_04665 [Gaiellales bacterium]|nr:hypothetical protein [Gaiellales bacterium]
MAELQIEDSELVLHLSSVEKMEGLHGDVRLPLSSVTSAHSVDDVWQELRGMRAPGTGVPGTLAVGTWRGGFGKDFAVVHGHGPGVVVEVAGEEYVRLLVSMTDADVIATHLATVVASA